MGGCCKGTSAQVSKAPELGRQEAPPSTATGAASKSIAPPLQAHEILHPPGLVPTDTQLSLTKPVPQVIPVVIGSPRGAQAMADSGGVSTPAQAAALSRGAPPEPEDLQLELVVVEATEGTIENVFKEYRRRIPEALTRCFDCSWERLSAELERSEATSSREDLEWYWLAKSLAASADHAVSSTSLINVGAANAIGLVVYKLAEGRPVAQVCHLSLAVSATSAESSGLDELQRWYARLPAVLVTLRREMFRLLPIDAISLTLWHTEMEDGSLVLDEYAHDIVKQAGYRWFQLTSSSDGSRGLVMRLRRGLEADGDPPAPEESVDLVVGSCLLVPYASGDTPDDLVAAKRRKVEANPQSAQLERGRATGNALVLTEVLRRHSLQKRVELPPPAGGPLVPRGILGSGGAGEQTLDAQRKGSDGEDSSVIDAKVEAIGFVDDLYMRLEGRRLTLRMVRFKDASTAEDSDDFIGECFGGSSSSTASAKELLADVGRDDRHVLCGGLGMSLNFRDRLVDLCTPDQVHVRVHATGRIETQTAFQQEPVLYLATEDDNIVVIVWRVPAEVLDVVQSDLYPHCINVLRSAPPSGSDFQAVVLPRFSVCAHAAPDVPPSLMEAHALGPPHEVLLAKLSSRSRPAGALRRDRVEKQWSGTKGEVFVIEDSFVLCVWHEKFDDLEVPLVATVITPEIRRS